MITACANKKTGALRLAAKCRKNEKAVAWNLHGPAGVAGAQGPAGRNGAIGPAGPTGPSGPTTTGTGNVTGGPCGSGEAVVGISSSAQLQCGDVGVYSDSLWNATAPGDELPNNTGGVLNTVFGTGLALTSGSGDDAFGSGALSSTTTGNNNTAIGGAALYTDVTGSNNAAFGSGALDESTVSDNTALGMNALTANTTGIGDLGVGYLAGDQVTTGSYDTLLGWDAGSNLTGNDQGDIDIANSGVNNDNWTLRIGTEGATAAAYIAGISGENIGAQPDVEINANGQLGVQTSSERFKTDIHAINDPLSKLMRLRPVSFRYKPQDVHGPNPVEYGLIAEQVAKVYPNLVVYRGGRPFTVLYQQLPAILLAEVQDQQRQITRLASENHRLESEQHRLAGLQAEIGMLARRVNRIG